MAAGPLSHDEFFARLGELINSRKGEDHGTVHLSQKRLTYGQDSSMPSAPDALVDLRLDSPLPIIIRATNSKSKENRDRKVKLSTVVSPDALDVFYARYAELCKGAMTGLKPRDRSKRKTKAKKKRGVAIAGTHSTVVA
ncbi:hypothetical protein NKR23_g9919 [Pleurostoma richardsiae]|uniref:Signal recognition particle subunit SRP14 n=1 Tax=Pleurostoma richardsiae TaxID=41990 RepID=A0AA38RP18_9PEZI|nr:hypothetical protein NKR23_g9919 [Pleurostoma richardsiae]